MANLEATKTHPMPSFWSLSAEGEQNSPPASIPVGEMAGGKEEADLNVNYLRSKY